MNRHIISGGNMQMYETTNATQEDLIEISKNLIIYNNNQVAFTQDPPFTQLNFVIKDHDKIIGGIIAQIACWEMVEIDALWIDENYRGKGLATNLLEMVENKALEKNCRIAQLDTFDFQAKDFYEKLDYSVFGTIENIPQGHNHYYMKKMLQN